MIIPQTNIRLLKSPIEIDYNNELTFSNITAQTNYFLSLPYVEMDECSYQRKEERIRFDKSFDELIGFNYCMYQNEDYSNKWFYAFINRIEYVDDSCSYVYITTDVYQTWAFDYVMKASYIEREHVSDDTIGRHTIPEGLETGELIQNSVQDNTELNDLCPVLCLNYNPILGKDTTDNGVYQGTYCGNVYQSYGFYIVKGMLASTYNAPDQINAISNMMKYLAEKGKADSTLGLFMAPKKLAGWSLSETWTGLTTSLGARYAFTDNYDAYSFTDDVITKPTSLDGYTPVNNKLLTFPYCYLNVNNNAGSIVPYRYEDFSSTNCVFKVKGSLVPSCSIKTIPADYKNIAVNYTEALNGGKYPICSYNNDVYTNWLSQNAINIATGIIGSSLEMGISGAQAGAITGGLGGGLVGGGIGAVTGGALQVLSTMKEAYQHSLMPIQTEGNLNSGDINAGISKCTFTYEKMSIKQEYARYIDSYMSMFGYKVNELKVPNLWSRQNWNYIKTINVNLLGDIPQDDMQALKDMFNRGVTLWHNPSTFLDYSQDNSIIV